MAASKDNMTIPAMVLKKKCAGSEPEDSDCPLAVCRRQQNDAMEMQT